METKLIKKLVETKSLSGDKGNCFKALKIIEIEIKRNNIPVFIKFNNSVPFLIAGEVDRASTLFLSHTDVVPARNEQFILKRKGNKLFGRGVLDMKGPMVACLDAFVKLWNLGKRDSLFAVTCDEEVGGFNGANFLAKKFFDKIEMAVVADGGSGENLIIIQKAPFHIKLTAEGKSAHASRPWEGKNAAENLLRCSNEIIKEFEGKTNESTTAVLTQFHSGEATNVVPNKAEAIIDMRIKQESEVAGLIKIIETATKKHGCEWEKIDEPLFFEVKKDNFFIERWRKIAREISGKEVELEIECAASDARFLWQELKIPVIVTSAIGGGAHGATEWVDINSLRRLSETIVKFINSL